MTKFDITITLFTIVYGLLLTELFASVHTIVRARKIVKWHGLPLLTAFYIFLLIIRNWWEISAWKDDFSYINILVFLIYGFLLLIFYLLIASVLPDKITEKTIDLKEYYFNNHRYTWGLMTCFLLLLLLIYITKSALLNEPIRLWVIGMKSVFILTSFLLASTKKYWIHIAGLSVFLLSMIIDFISLSAK